MALAAPEPCVFISDSGDNPTAGGVGDLPIVLAHLLRAAVPSAVLASIPDAAAVAVCVAAGVGATVQVALGGKLDQIHAQPLPVTGTVQALGADVVGGTQAVLRVGTVDVIVTERRKPFHYLDDFRRMGVEPRAYKIVVVKIGYLVPDLQQAAPPRVVSAQPRRGESGYRAPALSSGAASGLSARPGHALGRGTLKLNKAVHDIL
ncbi:MAG: hypothetical protein HC893_00220 [Chloroflexaceae bacterium]|nr:hypothetical protein [Chloroflexaceae bacterium]